MIIGPIIILITVKVRVSIKMTACIFIIVTSINVGTALRNLQILSDASNPVTVRVGCSPSDPVAEPVAEPVADPVADPVAEPVADPVAVLLPILSSLLQPEALLLLP